MEDNIKITEERNTDGTMFAVRITSPNPISTSELILALECYLNDLTRTEAQLREPGVQTH